MRSIICPKCGFEISTGVDGYPMIVWGVCPECGAKFTSEGELDTQIGWVQIGCWVPPNEEKEEETNKSLDARNKEAWEMPFSEFSQTLWGTEWVIARKGTKRGIKGTPKFLTQKEYAEGVEKHKEIIKQALKEGKTIPERVLRGYPNLTKDGKEEKKSKSLEEQVLDYFKSKGTVPNYSREWLAKQQKLGKTFQELKPRIDALIEDRREWEKRVKSENERRKEDVISEVLDETRIKKQAEAYTAMKILWENRDKWNNRRELIKAGDRRWNLSTSKYVSANYERLVELTEEAMRRFN